LSEIAFALKLGVPVVGLDTWQLTRRGQPIPSIIEVQTPVEAIDKALALIGI
jgi:hypothetical protein